MKPRIDKKKLKVRFLGGVGEIGKNMTALEYGKDIIVIIFLFLHKKFDYFNFWFSKI